MRSLLKLKPWEIPILWGFIGEDPGIDPRSLATHALVKIGKPAVPALIEALKDPKWYVREYASSALAKIKDPRAVDALLVAIRDDRHEVSLNAYTALIGMVDDCHVDSLLEALNDPRRHVRFLPFFP
jgi:HEAT repeat protein